MVIPQIREDSNELQSKTYNCIIIVIITIHIKDNTRQGNPTAETAALLYPKKRKKKETTSPLCCIIISSIHVKEIVTQPEMDVVAIMSCIRITS